MTGTTRRTDNGDVITGRRNWFEDTKHIRRRKGSKTMVVHYTLQGPTGKGGGRLEPEASGSHTEQACQSDHQVNNEWWAAQVASNKEYDTAREIINLCALEEKDVLIPRRMVYDVKDDKLDKKTEMVLPGYILLRLGAQKAFKGLQTMRNYIDILGKVSPDEMHIVKEYENITKRNRCTHW